MNKHQLRVMMSSKSNEWETPDELFDGLNEVFNFTLDAAAQPENARCDKYYTNGNVMCGRHVVTRSGLEHSWKGETVFLNPPYGRGIDKWVEKAYYESIDDDKPKVLLIPARTDTKFFSEFCCYAQEIYFIKGRLSFNNRTLPSYKEDGSHKVSPATFPSVIVVFYDGEELRNVKWCSRDFKDVW